MRLIPISSEKAMRLIESENTMIFQTDRSSRKENIKKEFEKLFNVKVESVRTFIRDNKKFTYIILTKEFPAIDLATKLGMI